MVDWYLDPETGDMVVDGGKLKEVHDPIEERKQMLGIALRTHRGEWIFDITHGLPFREEILVKSPNLGALSTRIRAFVLGLEGIIGVTQCDLVLRPDIRALEIRLNAEVPEGITGPFTVIVSLAPNRTEPAG